MTTTYKLYRDNVLIASPSGTSYNDTGLTNGTQYSYEVSAVVGGVEGPRSAAVLATPTAAAVASLTPANTQAQFQAAVANMSIDIIELAGGTYANWTNVGLNVDRTARPLLVRPAPGAAVIWDGNAASGDGLFYPGWTSKCAYITFDPAGTGGSFEIRNFVIYQTGLIHTAWVDHVAFNGFRVRSCNSTAASNYMTPWAFYISTDGTHRGQYITCNDWDFATGSDHKVNFFQIYHTPSVDHVTALRNVVQGDIGTGKCYWGFVGRYTATDVVVADWTIANTLYPFDSQGPAGTVSNMTSTGSANAPIINAPMIGSGNSWA